MTRKLFFSLIIATVILLPVFSQEVVDFSVRQNTLNGYKGITITSYSGAEKNVVIPSVINGMPVTSIGDQAFMLAGLTSVAIPDTVVSIGRQAFFGNQLEEVAIPASVRRIGVGAFDNNRIITVRGSRSANPNITVLEEEAFIPKENKELVLNVPSNLGSAPAKGGDVPVVITTIPGSGANGSAVIATQFVAPEGRLGRDEIVSTVEIQQPILNKGNTGNPEYIVNTTMPLDGLTVTRYETIQEKRVREAARQAKLKEDAERSRHYTPPAASKSPAPSAQAQAPAANTQPPKASAQNTQPPKPAQPANAPANNAATAPSAVQTTVISVQVPPSQSGAAVQTITVEEKEPQVVSAPPASKPTPINAPTASPELKTRPSYPGTAQNAQGTFSFKAWSDYNTAVITGYRSAYKDVVIPSTVSGLTIVGIGLSAFNGQNITSVIIPPTVQRIENGAFASNLMTYLALPESVRYIGHQAFAGNQIKSITIGSGVTLSLDSFNFDFANFYNSNDQAGGTYIWSAATQSWTHAIPQTNYKIIINEGF